MGAQSKFQQGLQHLRAERLELAERCFRAAVVAQPDYHPAHFNLGLVLQKRGRYQKALRAYQTAAQMDPGRARAYIAMASVFYEWGDHDAVEAHLRQAVSAQPESAEAYWRLGGQLKMVGQYEAARDAYNQALNLEPDNVDARFGRSIVCLTMGDLPAAWPDYEFRPYNRSVAPALAPRWRGEDPSGKTILVHGEQGLGDAIQFMRYIPLLASRGARIILAVHKSLTSLAARLAGVSAIVTDDDPLPRFDWSCSLDSLPMHFKTAVETIPASMPYLSVDTDRLAYWRQKFAASGKFTVAIAWSGNPVHPNDRYRSMLFCDIAALLRREDIHFVVLQKDVTSAVDHAPGNMLLLGPKLANFSEIGAVISAADLVISVDTVFCHLAGALGRPVWTLLPFVADWRWLRNRCESPWYPTMKLYRQPKFGNWPSVIRVILADLERAVEENRPRSLNSAEN